MPKDKTPPSPTGKPEKEKKQDTFTITGVTISYNKISQLKGLLSLVQKSNKLKVLKKIQKAGVKGITVMDICADPELGLTQSHTSIILASFRKAQLVKTERNHKFVSYKINQETFRGLNQIMALAEELGIVK